MNSSCSPVQMNAGILALKALTPAIFRLDLEAPEIAEAIRPGQFVMIRSASGDDPLLGRPLAVYDVQRDASCKATSLSVVFQVFGKGTARLSQMRDGDQVRIWGPLGHPFEITPPPGNIWFVAGGIGYTPFLALSKWWNGQGQFGPPIESPQISRNIDFLYGVRNASLIVACGPEPMLAAVSKWSETHGLKCWVSLENQMACGFGACFSCVAPIRQSDGSVDLRRVCLEGPIFDSTNVAWHS